MVSWHQMGAARDLEAQGLHGVPLPRAEDTPIPGLMVFADTAHRRLLVLQGDGSTIDLLEVWRLAEDCVRNWHKGDALPHFTGDFKRLTKLTEALNGSRAHQQRGKE